MTSSKVRSKVRGKSGLDWNLMGSFDPVTDMSVVEVFCGVDGVPVLTYSQAGNDRGTRKLVKSLTTESRTLARARADFGV